MRKLQITFAYDKNVLVDTWVTNVEEAIEHYPICEFYESVLRDDGKDVTIDVTVDNIYFRVTKLKE